MKTHDFLNKYIDHLTKHLGKKTIIEFLFKRMGEDYIYNATRRELIDHRYNRARNALSRTNRRLLIKAIDRDRCQYCGKKVDYYEINHVVPLDELGTNSLDNLAVSCHRCNRTEHKESPEDIKKKVTEKRKDYVYERCVKFFETQKGRSILKRFFEEEP